ncbi:MAG: hypothetical protein AAF790_00420 [Planctomycetota bacterium]
MAPQPKDNTPQSNGQASAAAKKAYIRTEEVKQQQVSHWDMDYLPREALEPVLPAKGSGDSRAAGAAG